MGWRIQRHPDGTLHRMVWLEPEVEEAEKRRIEENCTLRYVDPNPFGSQTTLSAPESVTNAVSLVLPFGEDAAGGREAYSAGRESQ